MRMPTITLDDDAWDDLLSFIEERRVIPIVGPELLQVSTDHGPRLLYDWLAEKLAGRLNVDISSLPQPYTLNDVVCWFLAARDALEARALYVEAFCDPVRRAALLKEAATLVNSVPAAMRSLHSVRRWHDRIVLGLREGNAAMAASAVARSAG